MFRRSASAWQAGPSYVVWGTCLAPRVNLASRLTALARPDSTLVDAATAADLADLPGMRLRQLAPRRVRGLGVIRVFEMQSEWVTE